LPVFEFEAKDPSGKNIVGQLTAVTEREAIKQLHKEGYFVSNLQPANIVRQPREFGLWRTALEPIFWPVSSTHLAMYFSAFASMLNSGMSMHEAVEQLAERGPCRTLRRASEDMVKLVLEGKPISLAMPRYPAAFSPFVIAMVEAGQTSGGLETAMRQLAAHFEHVKELENLARAQSFYTKILIFALIVIPTLAPFILEGSEAWLPIIARRIITVALGFSIIWYGWRSLMRLDILRRGVDRVKLLIPWVGSLVRRGAVARWCRAMALLYAAGVPVHSALQAAGLASGNAAIAASTRRLAYMVLAGEPISTLMEESGDFPDQAVSMMLVGEKSGSVDSSLNKVADYYEAEVATGSKQGIMVATFLAYLVVAGIFGYYIITGWMDYTDMFNEFLREEP